jgi:hypothetical protein
MLGDKKNYSVNSNSCENDAIAAARHTARDNVTDLGPFIGFA